MNQQPPARLHRVLHACAVTVLVAVVAGLIGSLIRYLSIGIETASFGFDYTAAPDGVGAAPWRRRLLVAALAGLVCGLCWWRIRRRPRGMPPSIAQAVHPEPGGRSRMPALVNTADALAQLLVVGAGMSLGREAAPRILAAVGGQAVLDRTRVGEQTRRLLIGAAAGAGLAAIYNAPIAAACYTVELILHPDLRTRRGWGQLSVAVLVCCLGTVVSWFFNHNRPIYELSNGPAAVSPSLWFLAAMVAALVAGWIFDALVAAAKRYAPPTRALPWTVPLGALAVAALALWQPRIVGNGQGLPVGSRREPGAARARCPAPREGGRCRHRPRHRVDRWSPHAIAGHRRLRGCRGRDGGGPRGPRDGSDGHHGGRLRARAQSARALLRCYLRCRAHETVGDGDPHGHRRSGTRLGRRQTRRPRPRPSPRIVLSESGNASGRPRSPSDAGRSRCRCRSGAGDQRFVM